MKNREARILEKTYRDSLTVKRRIPVTDDTTQETVMKETVIHENVKCGLSTSGTAAPEKDDENHRHTVEDNFTIFTVPDIFCIAGDIAVVVTELGQTYIGTCGKSMGYVSHMQTPFLVERVV